MDIAVTGASGFIGVSLVAALRDEGHRVRTLVRHDTSAPDEISWDPPTGRLDGADLEGLDAVVHLAGEPIAARRWSDEQKRRILDSRTQGTGLLASTLAELDRPPAVLVSASAIGVYGERGDEVLTEDAPAGTGFLAEVVRAWEASAAPAADAGIRVAFARTGIVLGSGGGALARTLPLFRLGLGGRLGSGRQWWSWISLRDEVRALIHLLEADVAGPVNLTGPEPVTNAAFTKALGAALHRPTVLPVPSFGPKLLLGSELANELLFTSARIEPRALQASGFDFEHPTVADALGWAISERR